MNHYPVWKNLLVVAIVAIGVLVALPNLFGEDPAVQVSRDSGSAMEELEFNQVSIALDSAGIEFNSIYDEEGRALIRFDSVDAQLQASDQLRATLGKAYVVALTLAPRTPAWLRAIGLQPMSLGLDLRGGVHFLFEVDIDEAVQMRLKQYESDFDKLLRKERIKRQTRLVGDEVHITLGDSADADRAEDLMRDADADVDILRRGTGDGIMFIVRMTPDQVKQRRDFAIQQNTITLRNRVNELGVAEPVVQRQGLDRIVVQLPGVQDPAQAERVLGATATLEFRLVCDGENPIEAQRRGRAPIGCELFEDRAGQPVLLKRRTIVTGDQLVDATSGFSQGQPAVFVRLDSKGAREMLETTKKNLKKPMAVVFVEQKRDLVERNGAMVEVNREEKEVINVATIQGVFSSNFQITGLQVMEARDLALLLRAGALAAPIFKVEERTIGPSLGQDNIDKGMRAIVIGLTLVAIFMAVYYRIFGLVADVALVTNLVLIVALLSMLQASLTLPGIAGIVLTVGMAVDANVLIFERIREELRNGNSPQASISAGYEKALSTIADANITTLIAAIVLFAFGTGPIKGFAVTLSLGIITSMFTAIIGTRMLINFFYGGRTVERLSI
ncbi:MAG: protein translocase subunit SecD [Gammaproteobacteria bacterium]|nr:protein translocase subunit SecD [Gammaproteobacteria bacterium]